MSEFTSQTPPAGDFERHLVLNSLIVSVLAEDYDRAAFEMSEQDLFNSGEITEFMGAKFRLSADRAAKLKWGHAALHYVKTLDGDSLSDDETQVIHRVLSDITFEGIIANKAVGEEPMIDGKKIPETRPDWMTAEFTVKLTDRDIASVKAMSVFREAAAFAEGLMESPIEGISGLKMAKLTIKNKVASSSLERLMMKVLDEYVYKHALYLMDGAIMPDDPQQSGTEAAKETIEEFGSNDDVKTRMFMALDKHIFAKAEAAFKIAADPDTRSMKNIAESVRMIDAYASGPEVAREMREEIDGLIFKRARAYAKGRLKSPYTSIGEKTLARGLIRHASSSLVSSAMTSILEL